MTNFPMKKRAAIFCVVFLTLIHLSCSKEKNLVDATVRYHDPIDNCGAYMIELESAMNTQFGLLLKPKNLKNKYKEDGLQVVLSYTTTDDVHDCGFGGQVSVIHLDCIKKR